MEDIVDQFIYIVADHHQEGSWWDYVRKSVKIPQSLFTLDEIATALNIINVQLTQLKGNKDWTKPIAKASDVPAATYDSQQQPYLPGHNYSISDDELVGFDKNRETLRKSMNLEECSQLKIIAVWGMGGIGKSTLVSSFFRNHASNFECHAWVSVSQSYKLDDIWRNMLKGIYCKEKKEFDAEKLSSAEMQVELKEILETMRYLIILDDVWTPYDLFKIKEVLADKGNGSRVIITTRIEEVASIAHDGCKIKVELLGKADSWHLFCRKAFPRTENHICPNLLQECGKSIVERCGGLPLAIVAIGSILGIKEDNFTEWSVLYNELISELHNNENLTHDKVLKPLGAVTSGSQFLEPDGLFPNHIPNPEDKAAMEAITQAVLNKNADLGIIFDTDVDRSAAVDSSGRELNRNRLIALMSAIVLEEHPGTTVVTDSVTSDGLTTFIEKKLGGKHHRFKRGYKNVIDEAIRLVKDSRPDKISSGHF
uniref:Uncharacterized protein n=1 Tax=Avena sativa TaxID=4498 RepID=A0ACD6ARG0_AVESA